MNDFSFVDLGWSLFFYALGVWQAYLAGEDIATGHFNGLSLTSCFAASYCVIMSTGILLCSKKYYKKTSI